MKRRIISIISVLAIICSLFQVPVLAAKTTVDESKLAVLEGLDILSDELPTRVTYNLFVNALMGFVLEADERTAHTPETFAQSAGLLEAGQEYNGNAVLTLDDAVKYGVILLGYNENILPGINYKNIASTKNLLKGVSVGDTVRPADMVEFLYNLLEAEPLEVKSLSDKGTIYNTSGKQTLLSMYRDIYVCKGIVTANEYTSIYSSRGAGEDAISIGDYTFDVAIEYNSELLGCNVTAYVKDDGENEPVVIYLYEREGKNTRLTIRDEDILSVNDSFTQIEYEDERDRIEDIKLAEHPKVIINGVFFGDYSKQDLMPENGYIEFIDNNGDRKYDILNVKSYKTVIVDSINVDKKIIKNEYEFTEEYRQPLNLDNVEYSVKKAGEDIKLSDIKEGDVLSVAMSRGTGERICEILVSSERKDVTVTKINTTERKIYDGSDEYILSMDYLRYLESKGKEINVGDIYEFMIDAFGRIVYSKIMFEDTYALFFRARLDMVDDAAYMRYLDIDGKWKEAKFAKKVTLDSVTHNYESIYDVLNNVDPQVVRVKFNNDGYVKDIRTATETPLEQAKHAEGIFTKTPETAYIFRPISQTFSNILYLDNSAKLFVIPRNARDKLNEEMYYVAEAASYFSEAEFSVSAYDVDRFGYAGVLSIKGTNEDRRMPDNLFVVTGITRVVDAYGDICERLVGCGSGYKDISFLTTNTEVLRGIKKGDVINFMLNNSGRISAVTTPITSLQDGFTPSNDGGTDYYQIRNISAYVAEIDFEKGRIILDYGTGEVTFPFKSSINCMEYNTTTQECDLINYDSFTKGDKVLVTTKHYAIRDMIRICE